MKQDEYNEIMERLHRGESVQIDDFAGFQKTSDTDQIRKGLDVAGKRPHPLSVDDLRDILYGYGNNRNVWELFTSIVATYDVTPEALGFGLNDAYTRGIAYRETALLLFSKSEPRYMMDTDELRTFQELPDLVTIYRGASLEERKRGRYGISWTLDRATAEFFAWRFDPQDMTRCVFSTTIPAKEVLAYFNGRHEQEIIADVSGAVEVAVCEPSSLFWERMGTRIKRLRER